ncbi:MAG: ligase-associated DNA damage response endonuclease PdeM [Gemmatimonadaceae bacterium]|nr:ligase-associated DNA damage response endonuclease PdeM [Gemmatimonadaceae bacterium]
MQTNRSEERCTVRPTCHAHATRDFDWRWPTFHRVTHRISLAGIDVDLLPDKALFLPDSGTLIVADVHWGKAATYRSLGVPVPHGTTRTGLDRLDALLTETRAEKLLVLGDLIHARAGMQPRTIETLERWRDTRRTLSITLVRGNHDYRAGDPPASLGIECVNAPLHVGPFALCHHPCERDSGYVLAGHIHPVVQLRGRGRQKLTLPCFAFGARSGLLPAFGEFTGGGVIDQREYARTFVIADDHVIPLEPSVAVYAP